MDKSAGERDMEVAVLGHGELEGPYTELGDLAIERDPRFPVRVTVQFYQAIREANIGAANMEKLARQISRVYEKGYYVGSLVAPDPVDLQRPTNWTASRRSLLKCPGGTSRAWWSASSPGDHCLAEGFGPVLWSEVCRGKS